MRIVSGKRPGSELNFVRCARSGSFLTNHEGHKGARRKALGFTPLCDFVSLVVDEVRNTAA
jgi:hypothetical protein